MTKWIIQAAWFASIILVSYLSLTPRVEIPYQFSGADKLAHGLAYAWLAILPFFGFAGKRSCVTGALFMIPLGIGLEIAQLFVPRRDFSIADMVANSAGVVLGIVAVSYVKKRPYFAKATPIDCRKTSP